MKKRNSLTQKIKRILALGLFLLMVGMMTSTAVAAGGDRPDRPDRPEQSDEQGGDRPDRPDRSDAADKPTEQDKPAAAEKPAKTEQSDETKDSKKSKEEFNIPLAITAERFEELCAEMGSETANKVKPYYKKYDINKLSSKDDEWQLLGRYPTLAEEPIYVLRDNVSTAMCARIEDCLEGTTFSKQRDELTVDDGEETPEKNNDFKAMTEKEDPVAESVSDSGVIIGIECLLLLGYLAFYFIRLPKRGLPPVGLPSKLILAAVFAGVLAARGMMAYLPYMDGVKIGLYVKFSSLKGLEKVIRIAEIVLHSALIVLLLAEILYLTNTIRKLPQIMTGTASELNWLGTLAAASGALGAALVKMNTVDAIHLSVMRASLQFQYVIAALFAVMLVCFLLKRDMLAFPVALVNIVFVCYQLRPRKVASGEEVMWRPAASVNFWYWIMVFASLTAAASVFAARSGLLAFGQKNAGKTVVLRRFGCLAALLGSCLAAHANRMVELGGFRGDQQYMGWRHMAFSPAMIALFLAAVIAFCFSKGKIAALCGVFNFVFCLYDYIFKAEYGSYFAPNVSYFLVVAVAFLIIMLGRAIVSDNHRA